MSRIYLSRRGLFRRPRMDNAELRDMITELQLTNSLIEDELNACREFLECKDRQLAEKDRQIRKLELKIEHLRLDLAVADKSLNIVTEKKIDDISKG